MSFNTEDTRADYCIYYNGKCNEECIETGTECKCHYQYEKAEIMEDSVW